MCINVYIIGMLYEYTFITELVYKGIHRSLDMQDWINSDMEGVYMQSCMYYSWWKESMQYSNTGDQDTDQTADLYRKYTTTSQGHGF